MAGISKLNIKFCGSHCGTSLGEDGSSQMGLEDIALFRTIPNSTVNSFIIFRFFTQVTLFLQKKPLN